MTWCGHFNSLATVTTRTGWTTAADGSVIPPTGMDQEHVPCSIQTLSARESMQLGREFGVQTYRMYFPKAKSDGTLIVLNHYSRVEATGGPFSGTVFKVVSGPVDEDGTGRIVNALLEVVS